MGLTWTVRFVPCVKYTFRATLNRQKATKNNKLVPERFADLPFQALGKPVLGDAMLANAGIVDSENKKRVENVMHIKKQYR